VAQAVRMHICQSGTLRSGVHNLCHPTDAERTMWCPDAHEHSPTFGALWTTAAQIASQRFTDVAGQRQALDALPLTVNDDLASAPVDIIELENSDFADP
jgi:hypothetical protein